MRYVHSLFALAGVATLLALAVSAPAAFAVFMFCAVLVGLFVYLVVHVTRTR